MEQDNLNSFFKKQKDVSIIEDEVTAEKSKSLLFDYLNDITFSKRGDLSKTDYEMKSWNSFMILKYLSQDTGFLPIINIFNGYSDSLTPQQLYKSLLMVLPRSKKFLKYPKLKEQIYKDEEIEILKSFFDCSRNDVIDYLEMGFLSQKERDDIKNKFGGKEKIKGR